MKPPDPFYDLPAAERELFEYGKSILGSNAGGLIAKLLKARKGSVGMTRQLLEQASLKQDPREWIAAAMRKQMSGSVPYHYRPRGRRISPAPVRCGPPSPTVIAGFADLMKKLDAVPDPVLALRKKTVDNPNSHSSHGRRVMEDLAGRHKMNGLGTTDLDLLVGEHVLSGVDLSNERVKTYGNNFEDASVIRFRLDGVVYTAIESPDDGYRSSMEKIFAEKCELINVFPPVKVTARKKPDADGETHDTLELIDAVTGKVIVEVGTDNTDDYYPCFVSAFWPENMATNAK